MTPERGGFFHPGQYGRVEQFAGFESLVVEFNPDRRGPRICRRIPEIAAAYQSIVDQLRDGTVIGIEDLRRIYEEQGANPASLTGFDFDVTSGRFGKRTGLAVRVMRIQGHRYYLDANLPEAQFQNPRH